MGEILLYITWGVIGLALVSLLLYVILKDWDLFDEE